MIRYATLMIALLCSYIVTAQNEGIGYLHSVKLEVDESIRSSSEYVKNFDGYTGNKGSYSKEIYDESEVNSILKNIAHSIELYSAIGSVEYLPAQRSPNVKKALGKIGKSVLNEGVLEQKATFHTFDYFPSDGFKKSSKTKYEAYYEVKVKVKSGGVASDMIVMGKVKKKGFLRYNIDVTVIAKDQNNKSLWKKKGTCIDFSEQVKGNVGKRYYKIESVRKLSLETIENSVLIAVEQLLKTE